MADRPADTHRRAHLDGLRAIAVVAVVAYHFGGGGSSALPGGFLGVDLFFVLSGYLITGLLLREHQRSGRIDLPAFWGRRLRRLLPALVIVLLAVCAATWWAAPPQTWPARRADVLWTLAYLANWHFVGVGEDYFAAYAGASPLRHTWSLSIEEQFYLVWPLLVAGALWLRRRRARAPDRAPLLGLSVALVLVSAAAMALAFTPGDVSRAYYGTDGRVQQLLVGAALAAWSHQRRARPLPRLLAPVALLALLAALVLGSDTSPAYYRGGALGFAVLVAVLVHATEATQSTEATTQAQSVTARLLSWRPLAALGRISYGVYLWHWPVLVLLPLPAGWSGTDAPAVALRTAVTLAASVASYVLVERPVLDGRLPGVATSAGRTLAVSAAAAVVVVATAVVSTRLPAGLERQLADRADTACPGEDVGALVSCVLHQGPPGAPVTVLAGDSTARALAPGLAAQAAARGTTLVQAAWQRCTPTGLLVVPNGMEAPDAAARGCAAHVDRALRDAVRRHGATTVVLSDFWSHHQAVLAAGRRLAAGSPAHTAVLRDAYARLVAELRSAGARTALVELPPPGTSVGPFVAAGRPAGRPTTPYGGRFVAGFDAMLREVAATSAGAAVTVRLDDVLCPGGRCDAVQDGRVIRVDGVHVSAATSRRIAPVLLRRVDAALARPSATRARAPG